MTEPHSTAAGSPGAAEAGGTTALTREASIVLLAWAEVAGLDTSERHSILLDWWSLDGDDPELRLLPPALRAEIREHDQPRHDPGELRYDPLLMIAVAHAMQAWRSRYLEQRLATIGFTVSVGGEADRRLACPVCGYHTLPERGGADVCPVCRWEDDGSDDPVARRGQLLAHDGPDRQRDAVAPLADRLRHRPQPDRRATSIGRASVERRPVTFDSGQARAEQAAMAHRVVLVDDPRPATRVCGVDLAYAIGSDRLVAAAVVLDRSTFEVLDEAVVVGTVTVPYVPGLLSFREAPWALAAIERLTVAPDLLVCDGQGIAHPARFGLACHLGVALDLPAVGCAKTHFVGAFEPPAEERGARSPLTIDGDVVGMVVRTQTGTKPLFVSPGHRISVGTAADVVVELAPRYRQPETTRAADHLARTHLRRLDGG